MSATRLPPRRTGRAAERAARRGREQLVGLHAVLEALRARRRQLFRLRVRGGLRRPELSELLAAAEAAGVPVETAGASRPDPRAPRGAAGLGIELEVGPLPELSLAALMAIPAAPRTLVALDGVEDPQNLGAIARSAEAAGVQGLVLTWRRAPPLSPAVARASAGAIEWLPAARVANLGRALKLLKDGGFWIFGCDAERGPSVFELPERVVRGDRVLVLGAEGRGLRPGLERWIDHWLRIPMGGRVASLNVAAAAAVALFELRRRTALADFP